MRTCELPVNLEPFSLVGTKDLDAIFRPTLFVFHSYNGVFPLLIPLPPHEHIHPSMLRVVGLGNLKLFITHTSFAKALTHVLLKDYIYLAMQGFKH